MANIRNLVQALDLEALPVEDQEEVLVTMGDLIFKSSLVRLLERMDDAAKEAFVALIEKNASEIEMNDFLADKVPGADEAVAEAVEDLTSDILAVTA